MLSERLCERTVDFGRDDPRFAKRLTTGGFPSAVCGPFPFGGGPGDRRQLEFPGKVVDAGHPGEHHEDASFRTLVGMN